MSLLRRRTPRAAANKPSSRLSRVLRLLLLAVLLAGAADGLYLASIWPDWKHLAAGPVPKSSFMKAFQQQQRASRQPLPLRWQPVAISQIASTMKRAVIVAEDSRFYSHNGIDLEAIRDAFDYNLERGRLVYGASTISQQTVKNLFLTASRDPLRKWHELVLTRAMEAHLKKRRILELYLNVAEFGPGTYGVEAAASLYWGTSAADLTLEQAVELAASLPSPKLDNPRTRSRAFLARREKIMRNIGATEESPTTKEGVQPLVIHRITV